MKTSPTWLVANWKMHGDAAGIAVFAQAFAAALADASPALKVVFCPPFPYLSLAANALPAQSRLALGAQHCHAQPQGAFTGEVSAPMLADIGCRYVILGHSERRAMGETCNEVRAKAEAALAAGLVPIVCVGESAACYAAQKTAETLAGQLAHLAGMGNGQALIAYEPVWAIGSGKTPTTHEIQAAHRQIKSALGSETPVLYGGSVNPANIGEILALPEVSGALIGSASLEISSLRAMLAAVA